MHLHSRRVHILAVLAHNALNPGNFARRYKTGVTNGPPCPQNRPLAPQITAADVQAALSSVQAMGEAALKAGNGPPGLHINVRRVVSPHTPVAAVLDCVDA